MEELPVVVVLLLLLSSLLVPLVLLDRRRRGRRTPPFSLLVVAGSGGHTTEILRLLSCLSESYSPRHYVLADSDKMSEAKIRSFEQKRAETFSESQFSLDRIPRSREVRQSWVSSVLTTLYSILYSLPLTYKRKPDLVDIVQWTRNMCSCLFICFSSWPSTNKENNYCVCREHLPCGNFILVWKDSLLLFRLFHCSVA
ncbi:UDP-N-acetylglucosamine transferase subunit ALG14 homolog isoform X2 [Ammospiza nelsoni]|uniref:UDP-N-acetylglucosamine transferase subunit ALG14 homolog isoform X2 n=1 Tax=Ammospiza caudacuta TaxID=2857398 RepID=UPI002738196D|nr:UDP-N-acetylglucosamine transferase subunit ALG14 homolog isoform X2 [Ammospiza caudacuta]XP_059334445.1 UDP-N-acetylglucosamine transferase subunit ALG14 homolog isoform X2 [Ammospiza nelsoni]